MKENKTKFKEREKNNNPTAKDRGKERKIDRQDRKR